MLSILVYFLPTPLKKNTTGVILWKTPSGQHSHWGSVVQETNNKSKQ